MELVWKWGGDVPVVSRRTDAIKAGFGPGGAAPVDARPRAAAVFLPIRGETEWRRKDTSLCKGCAFAIPLNLKARVLSGRCLFLGLR